MDNTIRGRRKKKYELNVDLKDIPTKDLVKMVREVVEYDSDFEDLVFNDNSYTFLNSFYSMLYSAIRDTSNVGYCFDDEYVQIRHKAFSYTSEEVRGKIMSRIKELIDVYEEWLAIGADLEYKHLFREVK